MIVKQVWAVNINGKTGVDALPDFIIGADQDNRCAFRLGHAEVNEDDLFKIGNIDEIVQKLIEENVPPLVSKEIATATIDGKDVTDENPGNTIQFKHGGISDWDEKNPILGKGEPAFVSDMQSFKIGDGITPFNELPFIGGTGECLIEIIKANGQTLPIINKTVDIPLATLNNFGVVLSCDLENTVAVNSDGTMEVNSLNVNKLEQTDGDSLVLCGGDSASE